MFAGNNDFHLKFPTPAARTTFYNKISSLCDESQLVSSESVASIGHQAVRNFEWNYDENGESPRLGRDWSCNRCAHER
jgi:hypothetical protein